MDALELSEHGALHRSAIHKCIVERMEIEYAENGKPPPKPKYAKRAANRNLERLLTKGMLVLEAETYRLASTITQAPVSETARTVTLVINSTTLDDGAQIEATAIQANASVTMTDCKSAGAPASAMNDGEESNNRRYVLIAFHGIKIDPPPAKPE